MIGETVSRYQILKELGRGGMGQVFLAHDPSLDRQVALKFLSRDQQDSPAARKRFLREARSAARLDHPFICNVFEVNEGRDGPPFIAMEYVAGENLQDRLKSNLPGLREAVRYGIEMAEALQCAHQRGIVHRDLKPSNVMLTADGHIKIMDFGLAKQVQVDGQASQEETFASSLTQAGSTPGTLAYMSPEQIKGTQLDVRSDIFAFGLILYQTMSGVHPFAKPSPFETASAILTQEAPPISRYIEQCPTPLNDLLQQMLAKDADRRIQSCSEVGQKLSQLLDEVALSTAAVSMLRREVPLVDDDAPTASALQPSALPQTAASPGRKPHPWRWPLLAAALIAVVVAAFVPAVRQWLPAVLSGPPAENQLAILPFRNISGTAVEAAVLDGLDLDLSRRLAGLSGFEGRLDVIPAAKVHEASPGDPQQARERLGATLILTGSLHRTGERLWLTANLIDGKSLDRLDSATVDAAAEEKGQVSADLAAQVSKLLVQDLDSRTPVEGAENTRLSAYQYYQQGRELLARFDKPGNNDKAIEAFEKALQERPDYASAYAGLSDSYRRKFRENADPLYAQRMVQFGQQAVQLDPILGLTRVSLGMAYFEKGELSKANDELESVLAADPFNARARLGQAMILEEQGRLEEAEAAYHQALELDSNDWEAHILLGALYFRRAKLAEAEASFLKSIDLAPDSFFGYQNLAGAYLRQGRYQEAVENYQKALEIRPWGPLYSNLGTLLFMQGRYEQAVQPMEKAIELGADNYINWANLADAYRWAPGQKDKAAETYAIAIQKIERRLERQPGSIALLSRLATYQAKSGRTREALSTLEEVRQAGKNEPDVFYRSLVAYEVAGQREQALGMLESALKSGYPLEEIEQDPELSDLRADARYHRLLAKLKP